MPVKSVTIFATFSSEFWQFSKNHAEIWQWNFLRFMFWKILKAKVDLTFIFDHFLKNLKILWKISEQCPCQICVPLIRGHKTTVQECSLNFISIAVVKLEFSLITHSDCTYWVNFFIFSISNNFILRCRCDESGRLGETRDR